MGDSWVWESEKSPSSVSSKENETIHQLGAPIESENAGLTTISLEADNTDGENIASRNDNRRIVENLRRSLDEKDDEIKQLVGENLQLNEKIKQLHSESIEHEKRLVALDQQHTEEIHGVLAIKNELQAKIITLESDLKTLRADQVDGNLKFDRLYKDYNDLLTANLELIGRFDEIDAKYQECTEENDRLKGEIEDMQTQLSNKSTEIAELNALLEEKDTPSREGSDKFELIDMEKDKLSNSSEVNRLQTELDEINEKLAILNDIKDQYDSNVLKLGSVVAEKSKLEEQNGKLKSTNDYLLEEVRVAREAVEKLELLQKDLDEINSEKEQNEMAFVALQEDELVLQREFDQLKADKEKLATELESAKSTQEEQIITLESKCIELETKLTETNKAHDTLKVEHAQCANRIEELRSMHDALKTQAVDLESRLVEENMLTQKQVIDLQSALNNRNATTDLNADAITFNELKSILSKHLNYKSTSNNNNSLKLYLDGFLHWVKDTYQHLADIEANRDNLMKQFENVSTEKVTLQHEYKTLKADLHHYEAEVAELMKNNGILLNELENMKTGKLETILEQNEDNILRLETQLEDCNKLNRSLQEEYDNMLRKLDECEEEKCELIEKVNGLKHQMENHLKVATEQRIQVDNLGLERNNLQLQLDQMRTDDSKLELQKCFEEKFHKQHEKIGELTKQLENLNIDHADLVHKIESLHEEKQKLLGQYEKLKASNLTSENEQITMLRNDLEMVNKQLCQIELEKQEENKARTLEINELKHTINELEIQLNDTTKTQSLDELQQNNVLLAKEKQELVTAIQLKHNENVQYHTKIQELNQMLITLQQTVATQSQQLAQCISCTQLHEKLTASHDEFIKLTDQITFLKEKSDILSQNLMIEQNNQKLLQQEKQQLNGEKETLMKDLTRLREHLIEMENGHTAEMIELQNVLVLTQQELTAMQEEARKSNTAYTSAR